MAIAERIHAVLDGDAAAFAEAIITGEGSRLSDAATEAMQISGLAHIISISGLHMSLVAGGFFLVCSRGVSGISLYGDSSSD